MVARTPLVLLTGVLAVTSVTSAQDDAGVEVDTLDTQIAPARLATIIAINVPAAEVSINGQSVGQSPIAPQPLEPGDVIELRKPGYAPLRYEHDGSSEVALYLERLEPLAAPETSSGEFPWLWVGIGAGVAAAAAIAVIVIASSSSSSEQGIPVPRVEP